MHCSSGKGHLSSGRRAPSNTCKSWIYVYEPGEGDGGGGGGRGKAEMPARMRGLGRLHLAHRCAKRHQHLAPLGELYIDKCRRSMSPGQTSPASAGVPTGAWRPHVRWPLPRGHVHTPARSGCRQGSIDTAELTWPDQQTPRCRRPRPPCPSPVSSDWRPVGDRPCYS